VTTATPARRRQVQTRKTAKAYRNLLLFVLPALFFYGVFVIYPLFSTIGISFLNADGGFAWLQNYVFLFTNPNTSTRFWGALLNNIELFVIAIVTQLPVALLMAALLTSGAVRRLTGLYRTLLFIPTTLSVVIVGFIWRIILSPLWGIVHFPLLGDQYTALPTITLMSVWQYVGIPMIFIYTALIAIPNDIVEAARLDGATGWKVFWRVKFPLIAPQFGLISILTFIWTFNFFDMIFALNGGAPGPDYATDVLSTFFFRTFFGWQTQIGDPNVGAATATVIFLMIMVGTAIFFAVLQRRLRIVER
jgi:raffinose/stachyose/melibiose transport system permease protein